MCHEGKSLPDGVLLRKCAEIRCLLCPSLHMKMPGPRGAKIKKPIKWHVRMIIDKILSHSNNELMAVAPGCRQPKKFVSVSAKQNTMVSITIFRYQTSKQTRANTRTIWRVHTQVMLTHNTHTIFMVSSDEVQSLSYPHTATTIFMRICAPLSILETQLTAILIVQHK